MTKVKVRGFSISLDGYGAGSDQTLDEPLGRRGEELHEWLVGTKTFHAMSGQPGGSTGVDEKYAACAMAGTGAFILGRNMFGPIRGLWPDGSWRGWWGANPPFHRPVFVLTHHDRPSVEMEGGTVFHFATGGIKAVLKQAKQVAGDLDVQISGGVSTVRQYLLAGVVEELHLAIVPIVLGRGESLLDGIDLPALGYSVTEHAAGERATHVVLTKAAA